MEQCYSSRKYIERELPYSPDNPSRFAVDCILRYIKNKDTQPRIIVLCGPVGTGKTWDACALAKHVCRHGGFYRFQSCADIHNCDAERLNQNKRCSALVLDDYGARQTEGALLRVFDLVNSRMHQNISTIITTNLISEIRTIDERMASRLNTACVINYEGKPDLRASK